MEQSLEEMILHAERMMEIANRQTIPITPTVRATAPLPILTETPVIPEAPGLETKSEIPPYLEDICSKNDSIKYDKQVLESYPKFKNGDIVRYNPNFCDTSDKRKYFPCDYVDNFVEGIVINDNYSYLAVSLTDGIIYKIPKLLVKCLNNDITYTFISLTLIHSGSTISSEIKEKQLEDISVINDLLEQVYDKSLFCIQNRFSNRTDVIDIIIHFPEIIITNSQKLTHNIKDLYVKYSMVWNSKEQCYLGYDSLKGARTTLTIDEFNLNYVHSHLNSSTKSQYSSFCLGTDTFAESLADLKVERTDDSFIGMLLQLDNYVRWESLEGGPYLKIASIGANSAAHVLSMSNFDVEAYKNEFILNKPDFDIKFNQTETGIVLECNKDELEKILSEKCILSADIICKKVDNAYFKTNSSSSSNIASALRSYINNTASVEDIKKVTFNNQPVVLKMLQSPSVSDDFEKVINPSITNAVKSVIEKEINKLYNEC